MPIVAALPAIASIGATVAGGVIQGNAAKNAAKQQQQGIDQAIGTVQPYNQFGQSILPEYKNLLTGTSADIQSNLEHLPGYQFALTQGLKAVQNSATARGLGVSGAAQKGAASYATGLADQTYGNQVNRLAGAADLGAQAASSIGNLQVGGGAAAAQGTRAAGQAGAGVASNIGNLILQNQLGGLGLFGSGGSSATSALTSSIGAGTGSQAGYNVITQGPAI